MSNPGGDHTQFALRRQSPGTRDTSDSAHAPSLAAIFWSFFKIGAFTFGGGWAMVPLIRTELVEKRKWVEDSEFLDMLAIAQSSPGPIAINTAVISGFKVRGLLGSVVATLGSSLPSFLAILLIATVFLRYRDSRSVEAVFKGMRPAIFGLLVAAVWQVGIKSVKSGMDVGFLAVAGVLLLLLKLHPIAVVTIAAAGGLIAGRVGRTRPRTAADGHENNTAGGGGREER